MGLGGKAKSGHGGKEVDDEVFGGGDSRAKARQSLASNASNKVLMLRMQEAIKRNISWKRRIFGIGPKQMSLPKSSLIHPSSPFAQGIACVSAALLVYSALITPVLVGFYMNAKACSKEALEATVTIEFDMFADVFFVLEICFTFVTGAYIEGQYSDDWRRVGWHYVSGMFLFDCGTSIPVAWIEWYGLKSCSEADLQGGIDDGDVCVCVCVCV